MGFLNLSPFRATFLNVLLEHGEMDEENLLARVLVRASAQEFVAVEFAEALSHP